jgi:hypothetical protein
VSIKSTEPTLVLPGTSSMDIARTVEKLHRPLAPLASSETFSDVGSLCHNDRQKTNLPVNNGTSYFDTQSNTITRNNDFDSLEILFDFPSTDLFTDSQNDVIPTVETPCRIRFSENTQIINTNKVEHTFLKSLFLYVNRFVGRKKISSY